METLKELLARVLEIDEEKITEEASPDNIASWDSMNGLLLVSEIEQNFNIKFTLTETAEVSSVADIKELLQKQGITEGLEF